MIVHIQLNITAGNTIEQAIRSALNIAKEKNCIVSFSFNGVRIAVSPNDKEGDIYEYWQRVIFSNKWYKGD